MGWETTEEKKECGCIVTTHIYDSNKAFLYGDGETETTYTHCDKHKIEHLTNKLKITWNSNHEKLEKMKTKIDGLLHHIINTARNGVLVPIKDVGLKSDTVRSYNENAREFLNIQKNKHKWYVDNERYKLMKKFKIRYFITFSI